MCSSFVITLTFAADRASAETTPSLYNQSLIDFTLAITLIESPCVTSACWDQAWHDLKLTTLGKRIVNRLYTRGCAVHRGFVQYTGDILNTVGVFSAQGGYHDECGGCHEYTGGCSVHWGFHTNSVVFPMTFLHIYHDMPLLY